METNATNIKSAAS
jgi:hypothetical protein